MTDAEAQSDPGLWKREERMDRTAEIAELVAELEALDAKRAAEIAEDYQTPRNEDDANRRQAIMERLADLGEA